MGRCDNCCKCCKKDDGAKKDDKKKTDLTHMVDQYEHRPWFISLRNSLDQNKKHPVRATNLGAAISCVTIMLTIIYIIVYAILQARKPPVESTFVQSTLTDKYTIPVRCVPLSYADRTLTSGAVADQATADAIYSSEYHQYSSTPPAASSAYASSYCCDNYGNWVCAGEPQQCVSYYCQPQADCNPGCDPSMIGDGHCDDACKDVEACCYDQQDCNSGTSNPYLPAKERKFLEEQERRLADLEAKVPVTKIYHPTYDHTGQPLRKTNIRDTNTPPALDTTITALDDTCIAQMSYNKPPCGDENKIVIFKHSDDVQNLTFCFKRGDTEGVTITFSPLKSKIIIVGSDGDMPLTSAPFTKTLMSINRQTIERRTGYFSKTYNRTVLYIADTTGSTSSVNITSSFCSNVATSLDRAGRVNKVANLVNANCAQVQLYPTTIWTGVTMTSALDAGLAVSAFGGAYQVATIAGAIAFSIIGSRIYGKAFFRAGPKKIWGEEYVGKSQALDYSKHGSKSEASEEGKGTKKGKKDKSSNSGSGSSS